MPVLPIVLALFVGCQGALPEYSPPPDDRIYETLFVSQLPPGDSDPEGERLPSGAIDRKAPLSAAEERQILWLLDRLSGDWIGNEVLVAVCVDYLLRFGARALPIVIERSQDEDPSVRMACAYLLGEIRSAEGVPTLRRLLRDPHPLPSREAAASLAVLGHHEGTPLLIRELEAEDPAIRLWASSALYRAYQTPRGYYFLDPEPIRQEAVARWKLWWEEEGSRLPP
ncbi:MAG: HEAT repeat domain-containing protein [Planctomycetes bacterium]|nr:HEAT repeat domain-containing protein [Planctomycetota bacterium]